ncbi:hypothetical protein BDF21DRAFT_459310 [Thamnidium elegans]|uniref:Uncharacterized protein n=1 Tax=Thamnidium elegans TaxID=101142 RepID=A0A8H7VRL6_9FUNG|nr:hypothetical protein INT48_009870 [Thamnidium elegans]KAI8091635.1 hypothetical protein BDF21DRAFT_459310 [Thamnidium elegans]
MAGNHPKKSGEKKETNSKQQQRKNSAAGKKENATKSLLNNQRAQAAGAAILSAVTSPQTSQQQQQALGTNGFNRGEIVEFLNMRFSDVLTAYHDTNLDPSMRPETYESNKPVNAWTKTNNGVPSAWGQQKEKDVGVMASGIDFLTELASK